MYQKHITLSIILALGTTMIFLFILKPEDEAPSFPSQKAELTANVMHDEALLNLVNSIDINEFRNLLQPILVERVVGTAGHENVKNYIINELKKLKWEVELDPFEDKIPDNKKLNFTNIIATYKSDAPKLLVLSCHYDSKLSNFVFIGATDSAVPCAMLLYLAKNLDGILRKLPLTVGLQLIFFDGEEAFVHWTPRDSLYGARHLAGLLTAKTFDAARNINHISRMSLFVLLDLLGAPSPEFYSYFENTNKWYSSLIQIEKRLLAKGLLQSDLRDGIHKPYFNDLTFYGAGIDDDHKPFLRRGVPIVHLIPYPFPDVWHTEKDDESAVNYVTVNNLLKILKVFVLEYLMTSSAS